MKLTEHRAKHLSLPESGQRFAFDSQVKGFGARVTAGGSRTYVVQLRHNGRKIRITLGPVGTLPFVGPAHAPGARDLAIAALTAVRRGEDPYLAIGQRKQPAGMTLDAVWNAYREAGYPLLHGVGHKRPTTIRRDAARYRLHLGPKLGAKAVSEIDTAVAQRFLDKVASRGQRNQCLLLLKVLLVFTASRGLAKVHDLDIRARPTRRLQNFLSPGELRALDRACVELAAEQPVRMLGFVALRVLLHTGCRLMEILSARREHFDPKAATLWLPVHKGGDNGREVLLSPEAAAALSSLPVTSNPHLFPSRAQCGHMVCLDRHADDAFARAGLKRLRLHDLRHSFASTAVASGIPLYTLAMLLGHASPVTSSRYSHLETDHKRAALGRITAAINGDAS